MDALSPKGNFLFSLKGSSTMFDLENFEVGSILVTMFEMMISSLNVPEYKLVLYHELFCMLLTES